MLPITLIAEIVPELMKFFNSAILPVAVKLFKFTLSKLAKLPLYILLLWTIYKDSEPNSEARKYLTTVLLVLGSILTFMTYSCIPFVGGQIIGAVTTPIAAVLAFIISLVALDFIFSLNHGYLRNEYPDEFNTINSDINDIARVLGKSWDEMVKQTQALLDSVKEKIDPNSNYDDTIAALINSLITYLWVPQDNPNLSPSEIQHRIVTQALPPLAKIGGSVSEGLMGGAIVGTSAYGAASSIFVQTGFFTGIKAALGLAGGIAVSAPAYAALTVAAPIGLAALTSVSIFHGASLLRDRGEKRKLSGFLADVLIAALPIVWVDGDFSPQERDTFEKFLLNPTIDEQDSKRVREAMDKHISFEEVLYKGLLKDENPEKAKIKHRLLLCMAWELAKADGSIAKEAIDLHDRMAQLVKIEEEEVKEIRRLILLKSGINIGDRITIVRGDITQRSVEAIVNSTNPNLLPGNQLLSLFSSGKTQKIDTVIHRAAGSLLQKECQSLGGCRVGEAKITKGYNLSAQWVIHTVSPIYTDGNSQAEENLRQCYRNTLSLARENSMRQIVFPALGTGIGKFPSDRAAEVALSEIKQFLFTHFTLERVEIICADEQMYEAYRQTLDELIGTVSIERSQRELQGAIPLALANGSN